jgi:hypothetical protein
MTMLLHRNRKIDWSGRTAIRTFHHISGRRHRIPMADPSTQPRADASHI